MAATNNYTRKSMEALARAQQIAVEYQHEIREGQEAVLKWGLNEDRTAAFLSGSDASGSSLFRMRLDYKPSP